MLKKYLNIFDLSVFVFIIAIIYVPTIAQVLGIALYADGFQHINGYLMAPVWAYANGLVLNIDVNSQYSVMIPIVVTVLSKWLGGISYERAIWLLMMGTIFYFCIFYGLTRYWLQNRWLAVAALILAIKWQMFHPGVLPNIWRYLTPSVIRYWWDLPVILLCLRHAQTQHWKYLVSACFLCGLSLAWEVDTGIYLTVAVYAYMVMLWWGDGAQWQDRRAKLGHMLGLMTIPIVSAMIIFALLEGRYAFSSVFWNDYFEHAQLFLQGWGAIPMYQSISQGHISEGLLGFFIPMIYVWTMLFTASLCLLKKWGKENFFVVFLCIYGLGLYHYYIDRSALTSYHAVCIPLVLVLAFWAKHFIDGLSEKYRESVAALIALTLLFLLVTDKVLLTYPDAFHNRSPVLAELESFYTNFSFAEDASMIQRLTREDQRVPVISGNEVIVLMQAHRKPFFYYFPLIDFVNEAGVGTYLHTQQRLERALKQLNESPPEYVFITKEFCVNFSQGRYVKDQGFQTLMVYFQQHYIINEEGKYFFAFKRK